MRPRKAADPLGGRTWIECCPSCSEGRHERCWDKLLGFRGCLPCVKTEKTR